MQLNKLLFTIPFILLFSVGMAQEDTTAQDTIKKKETQHVKAIFAFDARNSFVLGHNTKFRGVIFGVNLLERHKIGMGVFGMRTPVVMRGVYANKELHPDATDETRFNCTYTSMFYEYVWLKKRRWEISTPLHTGVGSIDISYIDTLGLSHTFVSGSGFIHELTLDVTFKVFRWIALNGGAGYRYILMKDKKMQNAVNSPVYSVSVKLLIGELYKMVFRRNKLEEW